MLHQVIIMSHGTVLISHKLDWIGLNGMAAFQATKEMAEVLYCWLVLKNLLGLGLMVSLMVKEKSIVRLEK